MNALRGASYKVPPLKKLLDAMNHKHIAYLVAYVMFAEAEPTDGLRCYGGGVDKVAVKLWGRALDDKIRQQVSRELGRHGFRSSKKGWIVPDDIGTWDTDLPSAKRARDAVATTTGGPVKTTYVCAVPTCRNLRFETVAERNEHYRRHHKGKRPVTRSDGTPYLTDHQRRLLELVREMPGLHPRDYMTQLEVEGYERRVSRTGPGYALVNRKLMVGVGQRSARRWYPVESGMETEAHVYGARSKPAEPAPVRDRTAEKVKVEIGPGDDVRIIRAKNGLFALVNGELFRLEQVE